MRNGRREGLQFASDVGQAGRAGQRDEHLESFRCFAALLGRGEEGDGAQVVEPVGRTDGQDGLFERRSGGVQEQIVGRNHIEFGEPDRRHQTSDILTETLGDTA
ncbi:hypothetical protein M2164_008085 [Streptomyces sp. SAI-208]|uniref:hypothetical protein n=1 Tax=Streptomyces sp. SAI-208 TaxID=2940550 RepID=UPI00247640CB|nr:hypothetical protein [Streptomyces sp. SAI-208]MDH6612450.1 hypothetical protein [Streptomyces sp. SAI-208]